MPRISVKFLYPAIFGLLTVAISAQNSGPTRLIKSVRVIEQNGVPAIEIVATAATTPQIQTLASPPRMLIDLPNSRVGLAQKEIATENPNVLAIYVDQYRIKPPTARIIVDLHAPYGHLLESAGGRLVVHLRPPEDLEAGKSSAQLQLTGFSLSPEGAILPVNGDASHGSPTVGSSITAAPDTTMLHLPRGGEMLVCAGTTLSVTASQSKRDLMFGMSTGAIQAYFSLGASADAVLTPDFRIMFAGPGEFHFAVSADSHGNTCVRALKGNASSAVVSELMGSRLYQVRPSEEVVFRAGQIDKVDNDVPLDCGCAAPTPVMRTETPPMPPGSEAPTKSILGASETAPSNGNVAISEAPSSIEPATQLPPPPADHSDQAFAPLVFNARDRAASAPPAPLDAARNLPVEDPSNPPVHLDAVVQSPPPEKAPARRGFLGRVKGFFSHIFH